MNATTAKPRQAIRFSETENTLIRRCYGKPFWTEAFNCASIVKRDASTLGRQAHNLGLTAYSKRVKVPVPKCTEDELLTVLKLASTPDGRTLKSIAAEVDRPATEVLIDLEYIASCDSMIECRDGRWCDGEAAGRPRSEGMGRAWQQIAGKAVKRHNGYWTGEARI